MFTSFNVQQFFKDALLIQKFILPSQPLAHDEFSIPYMLEAVVTHSSVVHKQNDPEVNQHT
jgi:hypothetical protein